MKDEAPSPSEWDFERVPDGELVACCYWEYARESAFIRGVRQRCLENWRAGGHWDERLSADLCELRSMGPFAEALTRGFHLSPGEARLKDMQRDSYVTSSFPAPWHSLPADERDFRIRELLNADWSPGTPFERADYQDVHDIAEQAEARWEKVFSDYRVVRAACPETSEVELIASGKLQPFPGIPVSILREEGKEVTAVAIHWARFTNDEIVQRFRKWVKANRPKSLLLRDGKGRNKARDWRVALERLAMMRLLHRLMLSELPAKCPDAWKIYGKREWYKERKRAGAMFHSLFPFLPAEDRPLSWPTKGARSK